MWMPPRAGIRLKPGKYRVTPALQGAGFHILFNCTGQVVVIVHYPDDCISSCGNTDLKLAPPRAEEVAKFGVLLSHENKIYMHIW